MGLVKCFDASIPPPAPPKGVGAVAGYIGGNTPHVWTSKEWQPFAHLRQFPIWVPDLAKLPGGQGQAAKAAAIALGWNPHDPLHPRALVGDMETAQDAEWWQLFAAAVRPFHAVAYGSYSTVGANLASFVWTADWNFDAALEPGQTIVGDQYANDIKFGDTKIDLSVLDEWLLHRGGQGARR